MSSVTQRNKKRIANQFSRAASSYDAAADVQLDIAFDAMSMLPKQAKLALDIGCGTGRISQQLNTHCQSVIAMDLAFGMLEYAKGQMLNKQQNIQWLQGDAEHLPLANNSVDLVFSSMALQWCDNQQTILSEIQRVLAPGGKAVLAIMCDGSFTELNKVWQHIDNQRHINQFAKSQSWGDAAKQQGLEITVTEKSYTTWHNNVRQLLASIKSIGANVVLDPPSQLSPQVMTSLAKSGVNRQTLQQLESCYQQQYAKNSQLPLTYRVCFIQCSKV